MFENIKKYIPNIVTASRGFVFLPLIIINSIMGNIPLALTFFIAGALTDTIDGNLARKLKVVSDTGKKLDAGIDVFFAAGTLITTTVLNPVMGILILFELAKLSICGYVMLNNKEVIPVSRDGKVKTVVLGVTTAIGFGTIINPLIMNFLIPAIAFTSILQVKTAIGYAKCLKKVKHEILEVKKTEIVEPEKSDETNLSKKKNLIHTKIHTKYLAYREEAKSIQDFIYDELGIVRKLQK